MEREGRPAFEGQTRARLERAQPKLQELCESTAAFWLRRGYDHEYGGFFGTLDRAGRKATPTDKGLVQEARHLWAFSTFYESQRAAFEVRAVADGTYRFICEHFADESSAEFVYKVSESGAVIDPQKLLYAQSFAIYGLTAYARVFGSEQALERALACFRTIDARAHDARHRGYDQSGEQGFMSAGGAKDTNTHIHLLESLTELYDFTRDRLAGARLDELARLVATRLLQPANYLHAEFLADFTPVGPNVVSYGHDLETAWLLLEAARALGRAEDPVLREAALRMGLHASERGFDAARGGFYLEGIPGGQATDLDKVWWVQFEALLGLLCLFELTLDPAQLTRFELTLGFIESQWDHEHGEWFWGVQDDGSVSKRGDHKGEEWKASYHGLRALIRAQQWIERLLAQP